MKRKSLNYGIEYSTSGSISKVYDLLDKYCKSEYKLDITGFEEKQKGIIVKTVHLWFANKDDRDYIREVLKRRK